MRKIAYIALLIGVLNISIALWISDDINTTLKVLAILQILQIIVPREILYPGKIAKSENL
jgi:hypothetical protein